MGRAGSGRSGGGRSGGGHSSSRSSGGHRVSRSSSSRAGSSFGNMRSPGPRYHVPYPRPRSYRRYSTVRYGYGGGCLSSVVSIIIFFVLLFVLLFFGIFSGNNSSSSTVSTIERTKLETNTPYVSNCIVDELGWFDNISQTETKLKTFYDETGIQPYIILKDYDSSIQTDEQKESWAQDYYEENIDNETTMLYVYFAEEDVDNDVGYMTYVLGKQVDSVMDSEAIEIFWGQIDKYWYMNISTDDVFVQAFNDTASIIMKTHTNGWDVLKIAGMIVLAIIIIIGIVKVSNTTRKHDAEKAAETERILNASMDDLVDEKTKSD